MHVELARSAAPARTRTTHRLPASTVLPLGSPAHMITSLRNVAHPTCELFVFSIAFYTEATCVLLRYLRRLQEAAAAAAAAQANSNNQDNVEGSPTGTIPRTKSPNQQPTVVPSQSSTSPYLESTLSPVAAIPGAVSLPPSRYPIAADTYHPHYPGMHDIPQINRRFSDSSSATSTLASRSPPTSAPASASASDTYNTYPLYNWFATYKQQAQQPVPPPNALPPLSYYYRPHRLEDVAPRETIMLIINLFFDFVYPLTPCVHKPSFMADLHSRREERDPLFFALVMSTCASTLVQVPRSYLPMERPAVRKLAQICFESSRHISVASYDPPQSIHVVIRYLCVFMDVSLALNFF